MNKNVILLTIDEMRSDGLGCYGNKNVYTPYSDMLAKDGVRFTEAIGTADLTPVCHASLLTSTFPNKNCIRSPFSYLRGKTMAEIFQQEGYTTGGFVGVSFLGSKHGFDRGFDYYEEALEGKKGSESYNHLSGESGNFTLGNWWIDEFFDWLDQNHEDPFFLWGHYFFVHQGTDDFLLEQGMLDPKKDDSNLFYLNPKISLMDKVLMEPLVERLKTWGLYDDCTIVLMSDHGANCGEHPVAKAPRHDFYYPQHVCLYDEDIHIPLIIKAPGLPKNKVIDGMVRQVDVLPTVLDNLGIQAESDFDGVSLMPVIRNGKAEGMVNYIEDLYEIRGPGSLQGMRTDKFKYFRNLSTWEEFLYDLENDPGEKVNLIQQKLIDDPQFVKGCRSFVNQKLHPIIASVSDGCGYKLTADDQSIIENRLRSLGYIE